MADLYVTGTAVPGFEVAVTDSRRATAYLVAPYADEYVAIMAVLESSIKDLTPTEVAAALQARDIPLDVRTVEARLDRLRDWTAASARTDSSRILRYADLMARNWRWTATPAGRQVQRFYSTVLAGTPAMREIPLSSLNRAGGFQHPTRRMAATSKPGSLPATNRTASPTRLPRRDSVTRPS